VLEDGTSEIPINEIKFKVQIAAGKNKIALKPYNFKGLKNIERALVGRFYKYYYGKTSSFNSIKIVLKKAKSKGYKTAFIIAFKNGKKIAVQKALKMGQN
jgi:N-acetylmuramoyl-L-alanine amidase